jgi:glycosyltransferase involved in cell wall biosynthesis
MAKRVLIIQGQMKQYRVPFFEKLFAALMSDGIRLRVAYSDPPPSENGKRDNCDLPLAYGVKVNGYWVLGQRLIWQPLVREIAASDLIVVEQANKFLMNHFLLLCSALGVRKKLAFWGLGENKQAGQLRLSEWYRKRTLRCPDWWFAYTSGAAEYLVRKGVPRAKISAVQNSIDTHELNEQVAAIPYAEVHEARRKLGIKVGSQVGVFCGMLDPVKDIPFLIESAQLVKKELPDFHLIIAGGGSDASYVERAAADSQGWIHSVGPKFGAEKAMILKIADVFTLPGRVGLAILDAFAAGLPLLTTDIPIHGPEVEYLEEHVNGLKVSHEVQTYARAVVGVLNEAPLLQNLKQGARRSADRYSIETMVRNFHHGIMRCLDSV